MEVAYAGRVTPPPRLRAHTPSPYPEEPFRPTWEQILCWASNYHPPLLMIVFALQHWLVNWDLPDDSAEYNRLRHLVLRRLTEGSSPWPTHTCKRCACLDIP